MENYICCPVCDSTRIRERHIGKKGDSVTGGVSGALSEAAAGAVTGATLDGMVFDRYECVNCEYTFD